RPPPKVKPNSKNENDCERDQESNYEKRDHLGRERYRRSRNYTSKGCQRFNCWERRRSIAGSADVLVRIEREARTVYGFVRYLALLKGQSSGCYIIQLSRGCSQCKQLHSAINAVRVAV